MTEHIFPLLLVIIVIGLMYLVIVGPSRETVDDLECLHKEATKVGKQMRRHWLL